MEGSKRKGIDVLEYNLFAGMDVDKRSISVTFMDHGAHEKSLKIPYNAEQLLGYVRSHYPGRRIAFVYEAGPTGFGLYDDLTRAGETCLVAAPSMIPVQPGARVKTNRLDSRKLTKTLRGGEIDGIRVPSGIYRDLRHLTQLRDREMHQVGATKCRIKALLLFEGLSFPEAPAGSHWSRRVIDQLSQMSCRTAVRFKLDQLLVALDFHSRQALETQRAIRQLCTSDPDLAESIRFLMSIPGVGWIVASHTLARIGDWRQLQSPRELGGFFGLAPRENSTGVREVKGSITRSGDPRLRSLLVEAAWTTIRYDPGLAAFYRRVYQSHPRDRAARKAIVAVARKLTCRMYCVLKERRCYQLNPNSPP